MVKRFNLSLKTEEIKTFLKLCNALGITPAHATKQAIHDYLPKLQAMADAIGLKLEGDNEK